MTSPRLALTFALGLLLGYEAICRTGKLPPGDGATQPQANTIRLERFALDHRPTDIVLVGSSLVANLQREPRKGDVVSLGLEGHSPLTGLRAVVVSGASPRAVVMEVSDPIWQGVDEGLIEETLGPWSKAKEACWSLQVQRNPMVVAHGWMKRKAKPETEGIADPALLKMLVEQEVAARAKTFSLLERAANDQTLLGLKADVETLEERGTRVFFVQIPREPVVDRQLRNQAAVDGVSRTMGKAKFLPATLNEPIATRDALHMVKPQAEEFREKLLGLVQSRLAAAP